MRRLMLIITAIVSMMLVSLYQYSWTLFVLPLDKEFKWGLPVIQLTFTVFTWVSTWVQPFTGMVADRRGPRLVNIIGGACAGLGWIAASLADTPPLLYLTYGFGSVGVGIFYATSVNTAVKWFPDKRGIATGAVVFGYGSGAALFNIMISNMIESQGYRSALFNVGFIMLILLLITGSVMRYPPVDWKPLGWEPDRIAPSRVGETAHQYSIKEMVRTWQWWVLYVSFVFVSNLGLMVSSQMTVMGKVLTIPGEIVTMALVTFPIANGLGRIVGGAISDRIGREIAMTAYFVAFGMLALLLIPFGGNPFLFALLVTLVGLMWGPIFTFYPSTIGDYYGRLHSTASF